MDMFSSAYISIICMVLIQVQVQIYRLSRQFSAGQVLHRKLFVKIRKKL
jgi:hypothetical protein